MSCFSYRSLESFPFNALATPVRSHMEIELMKRLHISSELEIKGGGDSSIHRMDIDRHDKRWLLTGNNAGVVTLYDLDSVNNVNNTNMGICTPNKKASSGQSGIITGLQWYAHDNGAFVSSSLGGQLSIWDSACFESVVNFDMKHSLNCCSMRRDGSNNLVATGLSDPNGSIRMCDLNTGSICQTIRCQSGGLVRCLDWSPQGSWIIASGTSDGSVSIWDIRKSGFGPLVTLDWQQDHTVAKRSFAGSSLNSTRYQRSNYQRGMVSKAHTSAVIGLKYSSCGNYILSGGKEKKLRKWNSHDGFLYDVQYEYNCDGGSLASQMQMDLIPIGGNGSVNDVLACPISKSRIALYPIHSSDGRALTILKSHMNQVRSVVYRDNGKYQLFSSSSDGMVLVWDAQFHFSGRARIEQDRQNALDEQQRELCRDQESFDPRDYSTTSSVLTARQTPQIRKVTAHLNPLLDDDWSDSDEDEATEAGCVGHKRHRKVPRLMVSQGGQLISRHEQAEDDLRRNDDGKVTVAQQPSPLPNCVAAKAYSGSNSSLLLFDLPSFFVETEASIEKAALSPPVSGPIRTNDRNMVAAVVNDLHRSAALQIRKTQLQFKHRNRKVRK